jgi:hypothetical protein
MPAVSGSPAPRKNAPPDRGLFWGVTAGIRSLSYNTDGTDWDGLAVEGNSAPNAGLFIGMDFGKLIIQAEIVLSGDNGTIDNIYSNNFYSMGVTGTSLLIPLIVKRDFHLGPVVFQPLAGLYFNFALGDLKLEDNTMGGEEPYANPPVGLIFGGDVGIALWKGVLFLDLRFAGDLGKTAAGNDPIEIWTRTSFMINLGYQFFF